MADRPKDIIDWARKNHDGAEGSRIEEEGKPARGCSESVGKETDQVRDMSRWRDNIASAAHADRERLISTADASLQFIEWACHLFFGRNNDLTHMTAEEYEAAHTRWFTAASDFLRGDDKNQDTKDILRLIASRASAPTQESPTHD